MTKSEVARLLTLIAAFDRRTIGETDVEAWHLVLADLDAAACAEAVKQHFTDSSEWLMPCEVNRRARAVRADRLTRHGDPVIDVDPDDTEAWQAELARARGVIASGGTWPEPPALTQRPVAELIAANPIKSPTTVRVDVRAQVREVAHTQRERVEREAAAVEAHRAARASAEAELEARRAAVARAERPEAESA